MAIIMKKSRTNKPGRAMLIKKVLACLLLFVFFVTMAGVNAYAALLPEINIVMDGEATPQSVGLQILFLSVLIALIPSILMVTTTFVRTIIVFSFMRSALGTQQMPPNQVLVGLALMLTLFLMNPVITEIIDVAWTPLSAGYITQTEAVGEALGPLRTFMLLNVDQDNLAFFARLGGEPLDDVFADLNQIPTQVLMPAFLLTELQRAFIFGMFIFLPFIVIDMVVASILMAMGMMMLPPAMISLPFKIMLFVLVDGWTLLIETLVTTWRF